MFCLPKEFLQPVKDAIKAGKFDMEKFNVDSATRRKMLAEIVGEENAKQVNLIYEKKLLLKNQEATMYRFISDITGLTAKAKEELSAKIKERYAERDRRTFDPAEDEPFLNELASDIYSRKYNTDISIEEAQHITELSHDMNDALAKRNPDGSFSSEKEGIDFGSKKVAFDNYIKGLKLAEEKPGLTNPLAAEGVSGKISSLVENAKISAGFIADNTRAMVASLDNSMWFRQGLKALKDPRFTAIWAKDFAKSWSDLGKTMAAKDSMKAGDAIVDAVKSEGYSRQNYGNGRYDAKVGAGPGGVKLDIGTGEEAYPTSFPARIPLIGRFFKGSEVAYEAGAMRLRMDIADKAYAMAERAGADMTDNNVVGEINQTVNMITGRSTFGKRVGEFERRANAAFFSIKFFKSNLDQLLSPVKLLGDIDSPGRRLAATNLLSTIVVTAGIMKLAQIMNQKDNKDIFNSTSVNFGKIRHKDMTIDLTGGEGGLVTMIARVIEQKSTNAKGKVTKFGGYGAPTGSSVIGSFFENKLSPIAQTIREMWIDHKTFSGEKPTIGGEALKLVEPISIQNLSQFHKEEMAWQVIGLIADGLGANTNVDTVTKKKP